MSDRSFNSPIADGQTMAHGKIALHEHDHFALAASPRSINSDHHEKEKAIAPSYVKFYKYEVIKNKYKQLQNHKDKRRQILKEKLEAQK